MSSAVPTKDKPPLLPAARRNQPDPYNRQICPGVTERKWPKLFFNQPVSIPHCAFCISETPKPRYIPAVARLKSPIRSFKWVNVIPQPPPVNSQPPMLIRRQGHTAFMSPVAVVKPANYMLHSLKLNSECQMMKEKDAYNHFDLHHFFPFFHDNPIGQFG